MSAFDGLETVAEVRRKIEELRSKDVAFRRSAEAYLEEQLALQEAEEDACERELESFRSSKR